MKYGFHRIVVGGRTVEGPVVCETDAEGRLLSYHRLEGEERSTIWVGGTRRFETTALDNG